MAAPDDPHPVAGHLPGCGADCRAGTEMDPYLARVLYESARLTEGLSDEEADRVLRRSWIDDDGSVHVRNLRSATDPPDPGRSAGP